MGAGPVHVLAVPPPTLPDMPEENFDGCELSFEEDAITDEDAEKLLTPLGEEDDG